MLTFVVVLNKGCKNISGKTLENKGGKKNKSDRELPYVFKLKPSIKTIYKEVLLTPIAD